MASSAHTSREPRDPMNRFAFPPTFNLQPAYSHVLLPTTLSDKALTNCQVVSVSLAFRVLAIRSACRARCMMCGLMLC